ncbi:MAG: N-acetyltransferase family protein [Caldimonas sp.]
MTDRGVAIRALGLADLPAYKQLRDEMLFAHPEAFTSDAAEERTKEPADYLQRLGLDRRDGGQFVLGAWQGERLLGAIGCERDPRRKGRHVGHVVGMMVRPEARGRGVARELLAALIGQARRSDGIEMLTLTVTAGNAAAVRLYETAGFVVFGRLDRAIRLADGRYHDKVHMVLTL